MLAVHLPTCGYRQRPPAPPLSEDEALAVAAFGLDRPEAAA
jgi:hypothetical protein